MMNNNSNRPGSGQHTEWIETHQDEQGTYVTRFGRGFDDAKNHTAASTRWRPLLPLAAAFLAGVLTIGGFMYAADQNNWLGGSQSGQAAASMGQGAGITTASASASESGSAGSGDVASIYASASPAVVKIDTFVQQQQSYRTRGGIWFEPSGSGQGGLTAMGTGTGFIFQKDGYIMTNQHVVADADEIQVTLQGDSEPYKATVVGQREDLDVAILKIEPRSGSTGLPTVKLGDSDKLNIGDMVVAIGNPYGLEQTLTVGVLSAKERPIQIQDGDTTRSYEHLLQTDASINPGNSGGPLLNSAGEVIGMNSAGESEAQGIGFAIPTTTMKSVIEEVLGRGANI
ncbi:S1C family serine protease [Paenibacillus kobensis]|uniref:S1C family serine protease n=1 Tax=Paenibacillus kobensis TaxID=59841 RepID=UPI000FDC4D50|nr:trypsin-like peptidase domain-containing protein [Paenibacillus kobensis]